MIDSKRNTESKPYAWPDDLDSRPAHELETHGQSLQIPPEPSDPEFPTIGELTADIARRNPKIVKSAIHLRDQLLDVFGTDKLLARLPTTKAPHQRSPESKKDPHYYQKRDYYYVVSRDDANRLFDHWGVPYRYGDQLPARVAEPTAAPVISVVEKPATFHGKRGRASRAFTVDMERVLAKLEELDPDLDRQHMPGTKHDLWQVAKKCSTALDVKYSTFDTYISDLVTFGRGQRDGATDFYGKLLADLLKAFEHSK